LGLIIQGHFRLIDYFKIQTHSLPSLQSTFAKFTKPTLQPNFAKEPFRPSRLKESLIVEIYRQCLTAGKVHRLCCAPGIGTQAVFLYLSKQNLMRCNAYDTLPAER